MACETSQYFGKLEETDDAVFEAMRYCPGSMGLVFRGRGLRMSSEGTVPAVELMVYSARERGGGK